ncbi:MAG: triose-phosphate isomerase [Rickettsiales bacterium]|nr:triose-phosphate isomerase [Rickettsiales bacterium]|tara:strand:+ start:46491 stop:47201 length:711 start_codon:yes stop_codon:yes gene_type:complete
MSSTPKKYIVANWKMNNPKESIDCYFKSLIASEISEVIICPSFVFLKEASTICREGAKIGAQQCSSFSQGAYTGQVSASMLAQVGVQYCLVGHSEQRQHNKSNDLLACVDNLNKENIVPIFCVGETKDEYDKGRSLEVIGEQMQGLNFECDIIIAYEPIWSIGTGIIPSVESVDTVASFIKSKNNFRPVLYGGSVNAGNAASFSGVKNIDGLLIGGASLSSSTLNEISNRYLKASN